MHTHFMQRCLELARLGRGLVSPNPLVGCVIVHNNKIIGEGWHQKFGETHAEVNAINNVVNKALLLESILYVNLEPCCHKGKTPPCTNLIISSGIKHVVVGMLDPFEQVAGNGIKQLQNAGVKVTFGVLTQKCQELNKRFLCFVTQKKPFVILKWAQTTNGFIAPDATKVSAEVFEKERHITGRILQKLVHKWRTYEDAIMVATNTAMFDNPTLNAREWEGSPPMRVVLDNHLRLPLTHKIFDNSQPTVIVNSIKNFVQYNTHYVKVDFSKDWLNQMLTYLYSLNISSLIVEGGTQLLNTFIQQNLYNQAIVLTSKSIITNGIAAPLISAKPILQTTIDEVFITQYINDLPNS